MAQAPVAPDTRPSGGSARSAYIAVAVFVIVVGIVLWRMKAGGANWVSPEELDETMGAPATPGARNPATPGASPAPVATGGSDAGAATQQLPPGSPQPGPAPPGKVWSVEHGHWHDDPGAAGGAPQPIQINPMPAGDIPASAPGTLTPQPDGPVPPGKVWSPEHGHWHDDPALGGASQPIQINPMPAGSVGGATPGTLTPQPDGPAPPGKVWSPEHGHWHDDPAALPPGSTIPPG